MTRCWGALGTKLPASAPEKCNLTTFDQFQTSCEHSGADFLPHLGPVAEVHAMEYVVAGWAQCRSPAMLPVRTLLCVIRAFSIQHASNFTCSLQTVRPQDKFVLSYRVAETQWRVYKSKTQVNS